VSLKSLDIVIKSAPKEYVETITSQRYEGNFPFAVVTIHIETGKEDQDDLKATRCLLLAALQRTR
jgi:hypothetical protein